MLPTCVSETHTHTERGAVCPPIRQEEYPHDVTCKQRGAVGSGGGWLSTRKVVRRPLCTMEVGDEQKEGAVFP